MVFRRSGAPVVRVLLHAYFVPPCCAWEKGIDNRQWRVLWVFTCFYISYYIIFIYKYNIYHNLLEKKFETWILDEMDVVAHWHKGLFFVHSVSIVSLFHPHQKAKSKFKWLEDGIPTIYRKNFLKNQLRDKEAKQSGLLTRKPVKTNKKKLFWNDGARLFPWS